MKYTMLFVGAVLLCLSSAVLANGQAKPVQPKPVVTAPTQPAGPGQGPPQGVSVQAIERRGYATNLCEVQTMLESFISERGGQQVSGDYRVVYLLDPPKGWYVPGNGSLVWRAPAPGETQHIEVAILDALTGQMLPITPTVDVINQQGTVVQSEALTFLWHPMVAHYGENYSIPNAGAYSLRVRAPMPDFRRHDHELGDRFTTPVDVTFTGVQITPQQPPASEMAAGPGTSGAGMGAGPGSTSIQPTCPPGTTPKTK